MYIGKIYSTHMRETFLGITGFDWDSGNREKSKLKHNVSTGESEQVFFNEPLMIIDDDKHSHSESRYAAFGITNAGRKLTVVYTIRSYRIRVISARDMSKKERAFYEDQN